MYLENSEQGKVGGEGELSAEAILSGQCAVSKVTGAAGLSSSSKGSAELDIKALVEYTEQSASGGADPPRLCVECCNVNTEQTEPCTDCKGLAESFEEYSSSNGLFESDCPPAETGCTGLSQLYDECLQPCECFKACKSSEHCANHSLASKSNLCCEHFPEHLLLFQPCKPSDQQSESSDYEPDELEVTSDSFGESEMPVFVSERAENLELPLDRRCEDSDSEQDRSTEDSEQNFTQTISDSMESLTCAAVFSEYDESQAEAEYTDNDGDEEDERYDHNEMEASDEESSALLQDASDDACERDAAAETSCERLSAADVSVDAGELHEDDSDEEPSQHCDLEDSVEEDLSSDDSKFVINGFPSDPGFDSSEESDKGAQDDSSDEPMQWDSFEENGEEQPPSVDESSEEDKKKTPTVEAVIEDYFDLFDRADCSKQVFTRERHYVSCFDGGDIHHHLHLEEEAQKQSFKTALNLKETCEAINQPEKDVHTEESAGINSQESDERSEDSEEEESSQRDSSSCGAEHRPDDWTLKSESSSTKDEAEDKESETSCPYPEYYQDSEDDEEYYDEEDWGFDGHVYDYYDEEPEFYLDSYAEEGTFAPCAREISIEGDVYEDKVSAVESNDSAGEAASTAAAEMTFDLKDDENDKQDPELEGFPACSEMEPYWALVDEEQTGECCFSGVEDYYAYQIKCIQSSATQPLNRFILDSRFTDGKVESNLADKREDLALSSEVDPEEESSTRLGITVVKILPNEQGSEPDHEPEDISELTSPLGIIHSVVSKHEATQSRDSEEESDDDSSEHCECEYCIPPTEQVPAKPLLSQLASNDPAKICVVIDLDETLVHSSFKPLNNADFIIPVEIEGIVHQYADPVSDLLDKDGAFQSRLFREACVYHKGNYVKDLSRLGRDLKRVIIIDNSPASYIFHPDNAVPVVSWFNDMSDTELLDLIPFFERLSKVDDIYDILKKQKTSS
ncbi:uncharacterized protein LOC105938025 isoform X2 [Fundulus heteroclitus]|uniref:uncharacterized protein LOC105938025 isoform X2 n=1 Tax=Fundulus heteroclitus TaxID=8078 RepID=UPI00165AC8EE|nr:uncharacterized protein LOC105938025 isoform X2 [Fundulus heteroclitus]